jgi:chitinase
LTHVLYAFAGINNKTGEAYLADEYADIQKMFPGDVADNTTTSMFGVLKQLYIKKKHNRNMKTLLSFGGWNLRTYFAPALSTDQGRRTFATTSVQLLKDLGFDGVDVDWEYPNNTKEASDLVETCRLIREELDLYARNVTGNPHFLLTLAVPAGPDHFRWFDMPGLAPYVDFVNLMAYDYQGSAFSNYTGHSSNLFPSTQNPRSTDFSTQAAVDYYLGGWPADRLTLGMPLYGRSFANTTGMGQRFTPDTDGSWEPGTWDYKVRIIRPSPPLTSPLSHELTLPPPLLDHLRQHHLRPHLPRRRGRRRLGLQRFPPRPRLVRRPSHGRAQSRLRRTPRPRRRHVVGIVWRCALQ